MSVSIVPPCPEIDDLERDLRDLENPGLRKCARDASDECRFQAIDDLGAALKTTGISVRQFARLCDRDLATVQDWLADGRKRLPLWAVYRLPRAAQIVLLRRLMTTVRNSRTGT